MPFMSAVPWQCGLIFSCRRISGWLRLRQLQEYGSNKYSRFHAVNIGSPTETDRPHAGFDREWRYDPARMGSAELNAVVAGAGQVPA